MDDDQASRELDGGALGSAPRRRFARTRAFLVGLIWPLPFGVLGVILFSTATWACWNAQAAAQHIVAQGTTTIATSCQVRMMKLLPVLPAITPLCRSAM